MSQHAIMEPRQGGRISHLIEVVFKQFDEQPSQHSRLRGCISLRACEHHVNQGFGGLKAGVHSVP